MRRDGVTVAVRGRAGIRSAAHVPLLAPVAALSLTYLTLSRPALSALAAGLLVLAMIVVAGPARGPLWLVPVSLLGAVQTGGSTAAMGGAAAVAMAALLAWTRAGRPEAPSAGTWTNAPPVDVAPPRGRGAPYGWIAALTVLLLAGFLFPAERAATISIVDVLGLLAGLVVAAVVIAYPLSPGGVARVTAVAGSLAGAYVLAVGDQADGRLYGIGLNPNYLGALLALPLVAAVGLARLTRRVAWLVPAAVCLTGVVATQSRGAFLASVVGVVVVLVQGRSLAVKALFAVLAAGADTVLPGLLRAAEHVAVGNRPAEQLSSNTSVREHAARFAADVAITHPVRGIGYGMFPAYAEKSPALGLYIATHDDYLRLAAETGVVTLVAFLVLLWLGVRGRRPGDLAVLRAVVVAYAVDLFFANQLASLVISMPFWLALGCLLASPPGHRTTTSDSHEESGEDDRQSGRDQRGRTLRVRPELV